MIELKRQTQMITPIKITIDKTEAARRQLGTAIDLWFNDSEPVAIHTLACAAHELLATLLEKQGKSALAFDTSLYRPGYAGEVKKALHKHYNFFKHADRDTDARIEFPVGITEMFLLMAIEGWRDLMGKREPSHFAYWSWHLIHNPEIMPLNSRETGQPMPGLPSEVRREFGAVPKKQFKMLCIMAFEQDASGGSFSAFRGY